MIALLTAFSCGNLLNDCDSNARFELSAGCLALRKEGGFFLSGVARWWPRKCQCVFLVCGPQRRGMTGLGGSLAASIDAPAWETDDALSTGPQVSR